MKRRDGIRGGFQELDYRSLLGKNIMRMRKKQGWTQQSLADRAGLHRTFIGLVERGQASISLDNIISLCSVFNVMPSELFNFDL